MRIVSDDSIITWQARTEDKNAFKVTRESVFPAAFHLGGPGN